MIEEIIVLLKNGWVSTKELLERFNISSQRLMSIINNLTDYPIGEDVINGYLHYKIMNKGDYK